MTHPVVRTGTQASILPSMSNWQDIASARKKQQEDSIPEEWRIERPSLDLFDVTAIPESCGVLSDLELEITDTLDIDVIIDKLARSVWSSVDVTRAFYKRAIVAHQLVSKPVFEKVDLRTQTFCSIDKLLDGDIYRPSDGTCRRS